jgi:hypothetical protein
MENTNELAQDDVPSRDTSRHALTTKQASHLFNELGVPRSPRSVQRFCESGHLDCVRVQGENAERYFVNRDSVLRYAEELKQIEAISRIDQDVAPDTSRHDAPSRDIARHSATSEHDTPRQAATSTSNADAPVSQPQPSSAEVEAMKLRQRVETLEKEKLQLAIDRAAKEQVINQMVDERHTWMTELIEMSRQKGQLEMRVEQLAAPNRDMPRQELDGNATPDIVVATVPEVTEVPPSPEPSAPPAPDKPAPNRSFLNRLFG